MSDFEALRTDTPPPYELEERRSEGETTPSATAAAAQIETPLSLPLTNVNISALEEQANGKEAHPPLATSKGALEKVWNEERVKEKDSLSPYSTPHRPTAHFAAGSSCPITGQSISMNISSEASSSSSPTNIKGALTTRKSKSMNALATAAQSTPSVETRRVNKRDIADNMSVSSGSARSTNSNSIGGIFENEVRLEEGITDTDDNESDFMRPEEIMHENKLLRKVSAFMQEMAENSTHSILVVNIFTKKILWVNSRAQIMFGKLIDDLVGQNINVLIPSNIAYKHDKLMDAYVNTWSRQRFPPSSNIVNPRIARELKGLRYKSDGSAMTFDMDLSIRYIKTKNTEKPPTMFIAYCSDISETKVLKQHLQVSKVIQMKSAEAIVVANTHGKILTVNATAEKMFGVSLSFLVAHNKNVKWFMPRETAEKHDQILTNFRDNVKSEGYDLTRSPVVGKSVHLKGRRPADKGDELFPIVIRVEYVGNELVAYIRDSADTITRSEFDAAIVGKVFPKCIKNKILRATEADPYEICEQLSRKSVLITDVANFTKYSNGTPVSEVYKFVNAMYKAFDVIIPQFAGELVKRTGDGVIALFGIEGKAKYHADRSIFCALSMLNWAHENSYLVRVGIASGEVGSGVFGDSESRPAWDVLGETVNLASRMESNGEPGQIQISESTFDSIKDNRLASMFRSRLIENVKGYGELTCYTLIPDFLEIQALLQRKILEIDYEKKSIYEREKRLLELDSAT